MVHTVFVSGIIWVMGFCAFFGFRVVVLIMVGYAAVFRSFVYLGATIWRV